MSRKPAVALRNALYIGANRRVPERRLSRGLEGSGPKRDVISTGVSAGVFDEFSGLGLTWPLSTGAVPVLAASAASAFRSTLSLAFRGRATTYRNTEGII